jgi:hypothetical protein
MALNSTTRKRVTIEQWVTAALADDDKGSACSALSLVFLKGITQEEIHTKELKGPQNPRQLSEFFIERACGYAQDLAGIQTFKLLAFYGKPEPQAAFPFTVADGNLTIGDNSSYSKHEATPTGLLGQLMKHNETVMQMNNALVTAIISDGLAVRRELAEATMLVRDAVMQFATAGHSNQMQLLAYQRETAERQMFAKALPAMVNHLTGREIMPDNFAMAEALEGMADRIGPNDLQMLVSMGKVTPQEAQALAAHFAKIRDEKEAAKKLLQKSPSEEGLTGLLSNGKSEAVS